MRWLVLGSVLLSSCLAPPSPAQRLSDAAYEMNTATRFSQMDVALEHVGSEARQTFMRQRALWGRTIRIVDVEFAGLNMLPDDEAEVYLSITWQRASEATVNATEVRQRWKSEHGHWRLAEEKHGSGADGLFPGPQRQAESIATPTPRLDAAAYRTRTIHEQ